MTILSILIILLVIGILLPQLGLPIDPTIRTIILVVLLICILGYLLGGWHGGLGWRLS